MLQGLGFRASRPGPRCMRCRALTRLLFMLCCSQVGAGYTQRGRRIADSGRNKQQERGAREERAQRAGCERGEGGGGDGEAGGQEEGRRSPPTPSTLEEIKRIRYLDMQ
eukprot:3941920-Rhodomonas_salina.2